MEFSQMVCPYCGAAIADRIGNRTEVFCSYCGGKIHIDDGVKRSEINKFTEYKETKEKNVNINKQNVTRYIDEAVLQEAKNEKSRIKLASVFLIVLVVALVACFAGISYGEYRYSVNRTVPVEDSSLKMKIVDVILGKASEKNSLIIMEQEFTANTEVVREGLFEWGVFKKNKTVSFKGTAFYTVELQRIRDNDIVVDDENKTVTVYFPKPELHDIIVNPQDFVLGDTNKGLFSFGELKFTLEEAFFLEEQAIDTLKRIASEEEIMQNAEEIAQKTLRELFEKSILLIAPDYELIIEMY